MGDNNTDRRIASAFAFVMSYALHVAGRKTNNKKNILALRGRRPFVVEFSPRVRTSPYRRARVYPEQYAEKGPRAGPPRSPFPFPAANSGNQQSGNIQLRQLSGDLTSGGRELVSARGGGGQREHTA